MSQKVFHLSSFRPGRTGACEAMLWEFTSWRDSAGSSQKLSIASCELKEAIEYMVRVHPEFRIFRVQSRELIEMVSGSPLN